MTPGAPERREQNVSELPWSTSDDGYFVKDANGCGLIGCDGSLGSPNASHIVRCVNSHAGLVAALKAAREHIASTPLGADDRTASEYCVWCDYGADHKFVDGGVVTQPVHAADCPQVAVLAQLDAAIKECE